MCRSMRVYVIHRNLRDLLAVWKGLNVYLEIKINSMLKIIVLYLFCSHCRIFHFVNIRDIVNTNQVENHIVNL